MFENRGPLPEFRDTISGVHKTVLAVELASPVGDVTDYLLVRAEERALRLRLLQRRPSLSQLADIYAEVVDNPQTDTEKLTERELRALKGLMRSLNPNKHPIANYLRPDFARINAFLSGVHVDSTSLNDHSSSEVLRPETVPMRYSLAGRAAALGSVLIVGAGTSSVIAGAIGYYYLSDPVLSTMGSQVLYPLAMFGVIPPAVITASVADCIKDTWPGILD